MRLAIIERFEKYDEEKPFDKRYYLDYDFKKIFDDLDVLLIPVVSLNKIEEIVNICDGLVVTGSGNDVHPKYYNDTPILGKKYLFDEFPFVRDCVKLFTEKGKPILGICAGIQEINVIFGGSLFQKISNHNFRDGKMHSVRIEDASFLYNVYKKDKIEVNSYHNQSINRLADGFRVTAISEDGIIEGIERDNIVAVQWHPEVLYDKNLFYEFIHKFF